MANLEYKNHPFRRRRFPFFFFFLNLFHLLIGKLIGHLFTLYSYVVSLSCELINKNFIRDSVKRNCTTNWNRIIIIAPSIWYRLAQWFQKTIFLFTTATGRINKFFDKNPYFDDGFIQPYSCSRTEKKISRPNLHLFPTTKWKKKSHTANRSTFLIYLQPELYYTIFSSINRKRKQLPISLPLRSFIHFKTPVTAFSRPKLGFRAQELTSSIHNSVPNIDH